MTARKTDMDRRARLLMGGKLVLYDQIPTATATIVIRVYQSQYLERIVISISGLT